MKTENWKIENLTLWLYATASCAPLILLGLTFILGKAHQATGGGEWSEGVFIGLFFISLTIIISMVLSIFAIILSIYVRSFAVIALATYNTLVFALFYITRNFFFDSLKQNVTLYVFFAILSIFFLLSYRRKTNFTFESI